MNAAQERQLLDDVRKMLESQVRTEEHMAAINAATEKNTTFREAQPATCEDHREKLWTALNRNRIAIVVIALGGGGGIAGILSKLVGMW